MTASASTETTRDGAVVTVETGADGVHVALGGRIDISTVARIWERAVGPVREATSGNVTVDGSGIEFCDGAGIGLLVELDRLPRLRGASTTFLGLPDDIRGLLDRAKLAKPEVGQASRPGAVVQVGLATAAMLRDLRDLVTFLGELLMALAWAIAHPQRVRWGDMLLTCEKAGVNATPVVCLLGFLMGLIIAFQSAAQLRTMGLESTIPMMMGFAMVRELGPLVTAIILAGRSGSAFAAELGTMKVTEELSALNTFGIDPTRFLVIPRLLAALVMTPLLTVFGTLFGLIGGYVVMLNFNFGLSFYVNGVTDAIDYTDFLGGLFKTLIFAFLVAGVGCLRGFQTRSGPGAVGDSTTRAVVAGIVLIVVANGVLGVSFYYLGI